MLVSRMPIMRKISVSLFAVSVLLIPSALQASAFTLGSTSTIEGPAGGTDSIIVAGSGAWTATANDSWLHTSAIGSGNGLALFSFDANSGAARTGTLTVAGQTLAVIQAGSTYVSANPMTTLAGEGLSTPLGITVDGSGNVFIADSANNRIAKWSPANQTLTTLVSTGLKSPSGVAVDVSGNLIIADAGNVSIKKWTASTQSLTTLVSSGLSGILGVAVDPAGNVYIGDAGNHVVKLWTASTQAVTTIISKTVLGPLALSLDASGNLYIADDLTQSIYKWTAATQTLTTLANGLNSPRGVAVDGSGNVYFADTNNSALKKWSAATQSVTTLASGLTAPRGVALDPNGNVYLCEQIGNTLKERPSAFVDTAARSETSAAGTDALPPVLPSTENLLPPFAPSVDQSWVTLNAAINGVVNFSFTANISAAARTANITVLGKSIAVTQNLPTTPPVISNVPPSQTVEQASAAGTVVPLTLPTAVDFAGRPLAVTSNAPAVFPLGVTLVTFTATDSVGLSTSANTVIAVVDTTAPTFVNLPPSMIVEQANRNGTAVNLVLPTATDICDAAPRVTSDAPDVFPLGVTTVHFSAVDASGNMATASTTVTVRDTTPPVLSNVPAPVTLELSSANGTPFTLPMPTATDICDAAPRVTSNAPFSGSGTAVVFPLGVTTVIFTAIDASGNSSSASTTVTVQDTTPPVIANVPSPIVVEQTARNGTPVSVPLPSATDIEATIVTSDAPTVFPLGTTAVNFKAVDSSGNVATASTTVTVVDTTPPVLSNVPAPVLVEQAAHDGTPVTLALPAAADICDAAPVVTSDAPALFPLGMTTVTFTATDASGNPSTASTTVTVVDSTPPVISDIPAPVIAEQSSRNGTLVTLPLPQAFDVCDANPAVTSDAPAVFPLGKTTVTFTAVDASGNVAHASTFVTIVDTTPPVISNIPPPQTVKTSNTHGVAVALALPTATDICDAAPKVTSDAPAIFPIGTTTVTFTATDASGNSSQASTTVTVKTESTKPPPVFSHVPGPITVEQSDRNGTPVSVPLPTAGTAHVTSDAPATFPLGTTTVTFTAVDASFGSGTAAATSTATTTVTIRDTTPPTIASLVATPSSIPPNNKVVPITLTVSASDICDAAPVSKIVSVTTNAATDDSHGSKRKPKKQPVDWKITGDLTLSVRAVKGDGKNPRVYTITVNCVDASGNVASKSVDVTVHDAHDDDQGKK